jgi:hypothetical protein
MTDDQVQTPKPGEAEPTPPTEQTEPPLENEDDASTQPQGDPA